MKSRQHTFNKILQWKSSAASNWFAKLRSGRVTSEKDARFREWLEENTDNEIEYEHCEMVWELAGDLEDNPEVQEMIAECDELIAAENKRSSPTTYINISKAAVLLLFVAGAIIVGLIALPDVYTTAVGEQRVVMLSDGSSVSLNTNTKVKVRYNNHTRKIILVEGQALFDVVHDSPRPFEVHAAGGFVRALGTRFDVLLIDNAVTVAVLEGTVEVVPDQTDAVSQRGAAKITSGESVKYWSSGTIAQIQKSDVERLSRWREGKLDFDAYRLADAISEFNRYTTNKLVIESSNLADILISGIFRIGDTESFLFALKETFNIRVIRRPDIILLVRDTDL